MRLSFILLLLLGLALSPLAPLAYAETDPVQAQIDANEADAAKFQVQVRDYYKAYLPQAESVGNSYNDCMKKCPNAAQPMDCEAQCRGDYMAKASTESIPTSPGDCYDAVPGAVPNVNGTGVVRKPCNGYGVQQYVNGSNSPTAGLAGIAYDDHGDPLPDKGSYKSDGIKPQNGAVTAAGGH